ncbi:MAG: hypothetical protein SBU_001127 [Candidatus Syntrophoarchaeum butanivorans]|uniref:Uncharacterized protein n=1 Tax=Candidatus Syntropharchaeum butanivorans TaxID=1839936 RepID=A0A1F2P493_9EURY|nr:MAG: hypothetical protein SBU_001127 [Candidatus Syntrophoarchaeum butanivorans]
MRNLAPCSLAWTECQRSTPWSMSLRHLSFPDRRLAHCVNHSTLRPNIKFFPFHR